MSVQLLAQTAKAWARLGNRTPVEVALDQGRELVDSLSYPDNPRNHFQVDPEKFDVYAMDCYRNVREDQLALALAETVEQTSKTPAVTVLARMRLAEAELTRALVHARAGELERAMTEANEAFDIGRQSLPSLLLVGREVSDELTRFHPYSDQARLRPTPAQSRIRRLNGSAREALSLAPCATLGAESRKPTPLWDG